MTKLNSLEFRNKYPLFVYEDVRVEKNEHSLDIEYSFSIEGLCSFKPTVSIETDNLSLINAFDSPLGKKLVFNMGLAEAVSYFKCVCPKKIDVKCGFLSKEDCDYWRHLWSSGLGEFFYINGIEIAPENEFVEITSNPDFKDERHFDVALSGKNIIPVGGGKDSCVTAYLLRKFKADNMFFTVNDQKARTDCVKAAGYGENDIIKIHRTIDKNLLELNKKGFLNGHTPFSSVVAFIGLYAAYLVGAENIVLSNEASANEGNTECGVNHQYSKSFDFEYDFNEYVKRNFTDKIHYFSLLRPFSELQIAKMFASRPEFRRVFRSCNRGSKQNIWCESCPKCLFVYGMLSAFLTDGEMKEIFSSDLFEKEELIPDFRGLTGLDPVKPFECVGTADEYRTALALKILSLKRESKKLPLLLKIFDDAFCCEDIVRESTALSQFNRENLVPEKFSECLTEMYSYVSNN